ncbi:hypothetical protein [Massilia sp. TS11]|uniref:phage head spike fiber domain-containing protein n=1 Tax=Massilia sp. TS11 TaxID=2908003 RepID=UPI001ED9F0A4|nr:hypothetical protein [Massilia sp. TS11]MCG2585520.1 hypothetical protein [Massilia sp. TS11]
MIGIGANLALKAVTAAIIGCWQSGAALEFDFSTGSANPVVGNATVYCTRSGATATRWNSAGQLETCAANDLRFDHDPTTLLYENVFLYSEQLDNSYWGKTGGTVILPDVAVAPDGSSTMEKWVPPAGISGANIAGAYMSFNAGTTYHLSIFGRQGGGYDTFTMVGCVSAAFGGAGGNAAATFNLATGAITNIERGDITATCSLNSDGSFRCSIKFTPTVTTLFSAQIVRQPATADGTSGTFIWGAQLNTGPTLLPYKRTGATAFPKYYACKGLLIEEARTNSIRNSTMVGAAAGSPGTLPNYWTLSIASGLSSQVVGTGVSSEGINYIDLRVFGTASASGQINIGFEGATSIAATSGQTWTHSFFVALVGGSLTGLAFKNTIDQIAIGGGFVTGGPEVAITPTSAAMYGQRTSTTATISSGSTAYMRPVLYSNVANGAAIDVTLRIGLPQLEQGAFATSVIPTSGAAVTRNADAIYAWLGPWFNSLEGTMLCVFDAAVPASGSWPRAWCLSDGTINNFIHVVISSSAQVFGEVYASGHTFNSNAAFSGYAGAVTKVALNFKANDTSIAKDGVCNATDTSVTLPTVTKLTIGSDHASNAGTFLNGHVKRLAFFRTRAANADSAQMVA